MQDDEEKPAQEFLIPVVHLMNHSTGGGESKGVFALDAGDDDNLRLFAFNGGRKGTECFTCYGSLPNKKLLSKYGFALEDNSNDVADFTFNVEVRFT